MPGLGRKREMIRKGQDWTQEGSGYTGGKKVRRYMGGTGPRGVMKYGHGGSSGYKATSRRR